MIRVPAWQDSLYKASIGVATLLDEIDNTVGFDEDDELYRHAADLQLHITRQRMTYSHTMPTTTRAYITTCLTQSLSIATST